MRVHLSEKECSQELVGQSLHAGLFQLLSLKLFSHWQMRDITNEAICRLYLACKRNSCFPGKLPTDAGDDNVSILVILQSLGLIGSSIDSAMTQDLESPILAKHVAPNTSQSQFQSLSPTVGPLHFLSRVSSEGTTNFAGHMDLNAIPPIDNDLVFNKSYIMPHLPEVAMNYDIPGRSESFGRTSLPSGDQVHLYSEHCLSYHQYGISTLPTLETPPLEDLMPPWPGTDASLLA